MLGSSTVTINVPRVRPHIARGEQRIGRHIQADMLHGAKGAAAGHLFIGRPLTVNISLVLCHIFKDFRAGCAGIRRTDPDTCLIGAACDRLIAGKQLFHDLTPLSPNYSVVIVRNRATCLAYLVKVVQ